MASLYDKSPLPIVGPPVNCVELTVYDNDGPEGIFGRFRFERSAQAVQFLIDACSKDGKIDPDLNYEIINWWGKG